MHSDYPSCLQYQLSQITRVRVNPLLPPQSKRTNPTRAHNSLGAPLELPRWSTTLQSADSPSHQWGNSVCFPELHLLVSYASILFLSPTFIWLKFHFAIRLYSISSTAANCAKLTIHDLPDIEPCSAGRDRT